VVMLARPVCLDELGDGHQQRRTDVGKGRHKTLLKRKTQWSVLGVKPQHTQ
jgi:hypothetical protein